MASDRITNWVGYEREINRDVFCAVLTGLYANPSVVNYNTGWSDHNLIKLANNITGEFFKQQNLNR